MGNGIGSGICNGIGSGICNGIGSGTETKIIKKYEEKGYKVYRDRNRLFISKDGEEISILFTPPNTTEKMLKYLKNKNI